MFCHNISTILTLTKIGGGEIRTQNQKLRAPTLGGVHKTYRNMFKKLVWPYLKNDPLPLEKTEGGPWRGHF